MAASNSLLLIVVLSISPGCVKANEGPQSDSIASKSRSTQGTLICHVGFDTQFIAGMTEARIANPQWCEYEIDLDRFLGMLREVKEPRPYRPNDVRAKVNALPNPYFVDSTGLVRSGGKFYEIDKNNFANLIKNK